VAILLVISRARALAGGKTGAQMNLLCGNIRKSELKMKS